jgi:hypothetical protein
VDVRELELRVDRLVVHGLAPADAARFREAFERELASLLGAGTLPPNPRTVDRLAVRTAGPLPGAEPAGAGRAAARAVFEGVARC